MCHYHTELWRHRRAVADQRPRDVVSGELEGLVEASRPARSRRRPLLEPVAGWMRTVLARARRLLGRHGTETPAPRARLRPGMH